MYFLYQILASETEPYSFLQFINHLKIMTYNYNKLKCFSEDTSIIFLRYEHVYTPSDVSAGILKTMLAFKAEERPTFNFSNSKANFKYHLEFLNLEILHHTGLKSNFIDLNFRRLFKILVVKPIL